MILNNLSTGKQAEKNKINEIQSTRKNEKSSLPSSRTFSHSISLDNDTNLKQHNHMHNLDIDPIFNAENKNTFNLDQNSMLVLKKLFGSEEHNDEEVNANVNKTKSTFHLPSSSSASSASSSSYYTARKISIGDETRGFNSKLEEFKRVVENSYNQHVLNKMDSTAASISSYKHAQKLSRQSSTNSDDTKQNTQSSASFSYKNIFNNNNNNNNNELVSSSSISFTNEQTHISSEVPCKIPYMSAYNVYTDNGEKTLVTSHSNEDGRINSNDKKAFNMSSSEATLMEKYFESLHKKKDETTTKKTLDFNAQRKKVSSTGSSLTSSPTSTSSLESSTGKKFHQEYLTPHQDENIINSSKTISVSSVVSTPREAKPPETPRDSKSAGSTFRRNLLKLSHSKSFNPTADVVSTKSNLVVQSFDLNKSHRKASEPSPSSFMKETESLVNGSARASLDISSSRSIGKQNNIASLFVLNNKKKLQPIESRNEPTVSVTPRRDASANGGVVHKNQPLTPLTSGRAANKLEKLLFNDQVNSNKRSTNHLRK